MRGLTSTSIVRESGSEDPSVFRCGVAQIVPDNGEPGKRQGLSLDRAQTEKKQSSMPIEAENMTNTLRTHRQARQ